MFATGKDRKIPSNESLDERLANESRTRPNDVKICVHYCVKYPKTKKKEKCCRERMSPPSALILRARANQDITLGRLFVFNFSHAVVTRGIASPTRLSPRDAARKIKKKKRERKGRILDAASKEIYLRKSISIITVYYISNVYVIRRYTDTHIDMCQSM